MEIKRIYVFVGCVPLCIFLAFQLSRCTDHKPTELNGLKTSCKGNQQSINKSCQSEGSHCIITIEPSCNLPYKQSETVDGVDSSSSLTNNDVIITIDDDVPLLSEGGSHKNLAKAHSTNVREMSIYRSNNRVVYTGKNIKKKKLYGQNKSMNTLNSTRELLLECSSPFMMRLLSSLILAIILIIAIHYFFLCGK